MEEVVKSHSEELQTGQKIEVGFLKDYRNIAIHSRYFFIAIILFYLFIYFFFFASMQNRKKAMQIMKFGFIDH